MNADAPLCIAHVDAETGFSGGEVQVFLLIEGLARLGHRSVLICPPGARSEAEARRRRIEVHPVHMRNELDLAAVLALARTFRLIAPDLVHLHTSRATWLGGLAARLAHRPAITTCRMERRFSNNWRTRFIFGSLVQRAVAISSSIDASLATAGVPAARRELIRSAVDLERVRARTDRLVLRGKLGARPEDVVLLAAAALVSRKGLDVLLNCLAELVRNDSPVRLWIAGDGPKREALNALSVRLGLTDRVSLLGQRDDVADLLAACDVFVIPSRQEGLGVAALEAMAAGRPVVASSVGGLREAVAEGRTGILVPPDDPPALTRAIAGLIADPALRQRLGQEGPRRVAEGHLAEQMVTGYDRLYRTVQTEWQSKNARA